MSVSFVIERFVVCTEFALVNRKSKIAGNLVSGPLLVHVLELLCWLTRQVLIAELGTRCSID